jgi:hypothetical protein
LEEFGRGGAKTPDELWDALRERTKRQVQVPDKIQFDDLVLVIDFIIGAVKQVEEGRLESATT